MSRALFKTLVSGLNFDSDYSYFYVILQGGEEKLIAEAESQDMMATEVLESRLV